MTVTSFNVNVLLVNVSFGCAFDVSVISFLRTRVDIEQRRKCVLHYKNVNLLFTDHFKVYV